MKTKNLKEGMIIKHPLFGICKVLDIWGKNVAIEKPDGTPKVVNQTIIEYFNLYKENNE